MENWGALFWLHNSFNPTRTSLLALDFTCQLFLDKKDMAHVWREGETDQKKKQRGFPSRLTRRVRNSAIHNFNLAIQDGRRQGDFSIHLPFSIRISRIKSYIDPGHNHFPNYSVLPNIPRRVSGPPFKAPLPPQSALRTSPCLIFSHPQLNTGLF